MKNDERERERLKLPIMSWRTVDDGAKRFRKAYRVILAASAKRKAKEQRQ